MRHIASSRHPERLLDVVPCYSDCGSVWRATRPPHHQTHNQPVSSSKHATSISDFPFDSTISHLSPFYANPCTTTIGSLYCFANQPRTHQRLRSRSTSSIAHFWECSPDGTVLSRGNSFQGSRARREGEDGRWSSRRTRFTRKDCPR